LTQQDRLATGNSDTLEYIHAMLGQLRSMAEAEHYDMVAHFIETAYIQAGDTVRGEQPARREELYSRLDKRNCVA